MNARLSDPFAPAGSDRRHEARERAMELLYEAEMKGCSSAEVIDSLPVKIDPHALTLVEGVSNNLTELDKRLCELLMDGWPLERLASCERWILRLGIFELTQAQEPASVVLSEATALAECYGSTKRSAAFVNGVLATAAAQSENS